MLTFDFEKSTVCRDQFPSKWGHRPSTNSNSYSGSSKLRMPAVCIRKIYKDDEALVTQWWWCTFCAAKQMKIAHLGVGTPAVQT